MNDVSNELKELRNEVKELTRLIKKLVRGEVSEPDEVISTKEFMRREDKSANQMYYVLKKQKHLKERIQGMGLLINYTQYKKVKKSK